MTSPVPGRRAATAGLVIAFLLIASAIAVPPLADWQVWARLHPGLAERPYLRWTQDWGAGSLPPLHGFWDPKVGVGTVPAVVLALAGLRWGHVLGVRLGWRRLLLVSYAAGLAWLLALALVDGTSGLTRALGNPDEYLPTARSVTSVHHLLTTYVDRIPYAAGHSHWPTHVAGHPPGMLLFFVGLVRVGLGGDLAAGLVVTAVAASIVPAVMVTLRALGREPAARAVAPFLVLTPAAVFLAVSADAVMAAVLGWGLACLALAARATLRAGWPWAVAAGLLLGYAVMTSYGLPLAGVIAVAVLVAARRWWPLPVVAVAALVVVLGFAAAGFAWWDAYPVLVQRYWDGVAADRPFAYWVWGDLAALLVCAGPMLAGGVAAGSVRHRADRVVALLAGSAVLAVLIADLSRMSKAEVERIWLPFVPWLTLSMLFLPERWRRPALGVQVVTALVVQHLLYTSW